MKHETANKYGYIKVKESELQDIVSLIQKEGYTVQKAVASEEVLRNGIDSYFEGQEEFMGKLFKDFGRKSETFEAFKERLYHEIISIGVEDDYCFPSHDDVAGFLELALCYFEEEDRQESMKEK